MTEVDGLAEGERVLWEGRPVRLAYAVTPQLVLFEVLFLLLAVVLTAVLSATPTHADEPPFPLVLAVLPLIFITLFVFPGTIGAWRDASHVRYVLTDRRAIIVGAKRRAEIDLAVLGFLEVRPWSMGTSVIYFAPPQPGESFSFVWPAGGDTTPAFRAIDEGERVYRLILDARESLRPR